MQQYSLVASVTIMRVFCKIALQRKPGLGMLEDARSLPEHILWQISCYRQNQTKTVHSPTIKMVCFKINVGQLVRVCDSTQTTLGG